ncbi:MAG: MMPL family transporter [Usitatibacter sp.]
MSRSRAAIAAWVVGLVFCIWQITQAHFVSDLSSFLPSNPTAEQRLLVDQIRDGAISRVALMGIEGADPATRARLSQALAATLRADPRFISVTNGAATGFDKERELIVSYRYLLSPQVGAARFTVEGLRAAISETIELLASPAGMMTKSLVPRDPTGETLAILERLRPQDGPAVRDGVWTSPDGARALLLARTRASGSDTDAQALALSAIEEAFRKAAPAGEARLLVTGPGVFSAKGRAMVEGDVKHLSMVGSAIIVMLLFAVYRSPIALGLGLVPVVSGALAGVAAVSIGFGVVHAVTLGFGTALIGEAVDYSIYLFVQAGDGERAGDSAWVRRFWPTIRLGVLASIAGFSALLFSGLPGLVQLGLYAISGLVVAALVTRFVLPALLPAGFRIRDVSPIGRRLAWLAARAPRARWMVALLAVAALAAILQHRGALWNHELTSLNPIAEADRRIDAELRAALGASDARHVVAVYGDSAEAALQAAERVTDRLDALVGTGRLGSYESPSRVLPSQALQRTRLASLPDAEALRTRLRAALAELPLRPERVEPFVADVERARAQGLLTQDKIAGTALQTALEGLLFRASDGRWTALVGIRAPAGSASARADIGAVREAVAAAGVPGAILVDLKSEIDRLYSSYFNRALASSAVGFGVIVALLFAALKSPTRVLRVLLPILAGVLVVAAWHVASGTRLTLLHLVGLLLVVAVGSNYALFFDRLGTADDGSAPRTLASLVLANATTVAGFGVLAFSSVPVLQSIGSTVALGAFLTLVFAAVLSNAWAR